MNAREMKLADIPDDVALSITDLARCLGKAPKTITRMAQRGELPSPFREGRQQMRLAGAVKNHRRARQEEARIKAEREAKRLKNLDAECRRSR